MIETQLAKEVELLINKDQAAALTTDFINKFNRQVSLLFWKTLPQLKNYLSLGEDIKANKFFLDELGRCAKQIQTDMQKNA